MPHAPDFVPADQPGLFADEAAEQLEADVRPANMEVGLPSGLRIIMRKMRLSELNIFADQRAVNDGSVVTRVLSACCEQVTDPGVYGEKPDSKVVGPDGKVAWDLALQGDRFPALVALRCVSKGGEYEFEHTCPSCEKRGKYSVNAAKDFKLMPMTEEARNGWLAGNLFDAVLPVCKRTVKFKLPNGIDEVRASRELKRAEESGNLLTVALQMRIVSVEGLKALNEVPRFLNGLDEDDVCALQDAFRRVDFGLDTKFAAACPKCGHQWECPVPFEKGFFTPKAMSMPTSKPGRP